MTSVAGQRDFLDEIVDERSKQNPEFLELVQGALEHRVANRGRDSSDSATHLFSGDAVSDDADVDDAID